MSLRIQSIPPQPRSKGSPLFCLPPFLPCHSRFLLVLEPPLIPTQGARSGEEKRRALSDRIPPKAKAHTYVYTGLETLLIVSLIDS